MKPDMIHPAGTNIRDAVLDAVYTLYLRLRGHHPESHAADVIVLSANDAARQFDGEQHGLRLIGLQSDTTPAGSFLIFVRTVYSNVLNPDTNEFAEITRHNVYLMTRNIEPAKNPAGFVIRDGIVKKRMTASEIQERVGFQYPRPRVIVDNPDLCYVIKFEES